MASAKAMLTIKKVLCNTQGATGEMLSEGLVHALQESPEERHELQSALLKMVEQVLTSSKDAAAIAEGTCQQKVNDATADLDAQKATVVSDTEDLAAAKAAAAAQKEKLEATIQQETFEEQEHQRVKELDEEMTTEMTALECGKAEVVGLLGSVAEKGNGEDVVGYLRSNNAETPLVAALKSVLQKEPSERIGFDSVALTHLVSFLEQKVVEWEADIKVHSAKKANIHAEMLGAWAVREVTKEQVKEATAELETAEAAVRAAEQKLNEAKKLERQKERSLASCLTELTIAGDTATQCNVALELHQCLVTGQDMSPEAPVVVSMEVDEVELAAAKKDVLLDVEMGTAITA